MRIEEVMVREILDSRGTPTVEVEATVEPRVQYMLPYRREPLQESMKLLSCIVYSFF